MYTYIYIYIYIYVTVLRHTGGESGGDLRAQWKDERKPSGGHTHTHTRKHTHGQTDPTAPALPGTK
jgi:hypothetical protein